jgi:hypothetical protein
MYSSPNGLNVSIFHGVDMGSLQESSAKDAIDRAADVLKLTLALATGALVFGADFIKEQVVLSSITRLMVMIAWGLLGASAAAGILALSAIPMMVAKQNYNLEDPYLTWPARVHQVAFVLGIILLGVTLASSVGTPAK